MTSLKDKLKQVKGIIRGSSKVTNPNVPVSEVDAKVKSYAVPSHFYNFMGKHETNIDKELTTREISAKGLDYQVSQGQISLERQVFFGDPRNVDPAYVKTIDNNIIVKEKDKDHCVIFNLRSNDVIDEGEGKVEARSVDMVLAKNGRRETVFHKELPANTDITNLNEVRYHLRDDKEAAKFMDRFVIVTDEEKKAYRDYESACNLQERVEQHSQMDIARDDIESTQKAKAEAERQKKAQKDAEILEINKMKQAKDAYFK